MYPFINSEMLYNAIEEIREEKGLSIYAMTKLAGISCATVYKWRDRKSAPSMYIIERICYALNIDISLLFLRCERLIHNQKVKAVGSENHKFGKIVETPDGERLLLSMWDRLESRQRTVVLDLMEQIVLSQNSNPPEIGQ